MVIYYSEEQIKKLTKQAEMEQEQREEEEKGKRYRTNNESEITCLQCKNPFFHKGKALLNTRGMTFFGLDWLDEGAVILVCTNCGFIHWFNQDVEKSFQR